MVGRGAQAILGMSGGSPISWQGSSAGTSIRSTRKGRVILPAKFRAAFERGGYLTENREGCLALWTLGEFERQMAAMQERAANGRVDRNRARLWASSAQEVEIDRQGRMAIPVRLRQFARARERRARDRGASTGSSCGIRRCGTSGSARASGGSSRTKRTERRRPTANRSRPTAPRRQPRRPVHAQPLDRHGGRLLLRPLPRRSLGKLPRRSPRPSGGCGWTGNHEHEPVMVDEVVALLAAVPPGVILDATVGTGGHAAAAPYGAPAAWA